MINRLFSSKTIIQTLFLLCSTVLGMALLLFSNHLISRSLGRLGFGDYSLILNVFAFAQVVFNFGIFHTINNSIVLVDDQTEIKKYFGIGFIAAIILGSAMSVFMLGFAFYQRHIGEEKLFYAIIISSPFAFVFLLNNFNELILQGTNNIKLLSFARLAPRLIYCIIIWFVITFLSFNCLIKDYILIFIFSQLVSIIYIILKLAPSFKHIKFKSLRLLKINRSFGLNIYIGSIIAVGASNLSGILISFFGENNSDVGFYAIALQFSAPLTLIPNILAAVSFKNFASQRNIPRKMILLTIFISIFSFIIILLFGKQVVLIVYGKEFLDVLPFLYLSCFGSILYGISDFFNRFLLSNGKGKELRNASVLVGFTLLFSNIILISNIGGIGASISTVISGFVYLLIITYYYKRLIRV